MNGATAFLLELQHTATSFVVVAKLLVNTSSAKHDQTLLASLGSGTTKTQSFMPLLL
jgi:hypothetical protein